MRHPSPDSLRGLILQALNASKMDRACFESFLLESGLPKDESEVDEFIKKRTDLYRETWIIRPLEKALKKIDKKYKREKYHHA